MTQSANFRLPVFYSSRMNFYPVHPFNPCGLKGQIVCEELQRLGLPVDIRENNTATREELYLAHDHQYINDILSLKIPNGFGTISKDHLQSLLSITGATIDAAREALASGKACLPTAKDHHAHYDHGQGMCTFHGPLIAFHKLRNEGLIAKMAIIDTDWHRGDGTEDIIAKQGLQSSIWHLTMGRYFTSTVDAPAYLDRLKKVKDELREFKPDLIFYQSGGDVHQDDPFGGVLSSEEMYLRDSIVFNMAEELGVPIAWNFSGGYQCDPDGIHFTKYASFFVNCIRASLHIPYVPHEIPDGPRNRYRYDPEIDGEIESSSTAIPLNTWFGRMLDWWSRL